MEQRIQNMEDLASHGNIPGRKAILEILEAGMEASNPYYNTLKLFRIEGNKLIVGYKDFVPVGSPKTDDEVINLDEIENIYVFGAGKGIQHTAKAIEDTLGDRLTGGHVVDKKGHPIILKKIGVTLGSHPAPDEDCDKGCKKILEMTKNLTEKDLVFTVVANGVSSLLTMPVPGVSVQEVREMTYIMQLKHGAPTGDLNAIRNHIDMMKGGRLSNYIRPAKAIHILSIDPGYYDQLMYRNLWLHSLPDFTTFELAIHNLHKWDAWDEVPQSIRDFLNEANPEYESIKGEEFVKWGSRIFGVMPGYRQSGKLYPAMEKARELGFEPHLISTDIFSVEAMHAGRYMAAICKTIERDGVPFKAPCALFSSGEMTVAIGDAKGIGGRNQEFTLAAAQSITGSDNIVIASVDTDGTDGPGHQYAEGEDDIPSCLAGGIVDGETAEEAEKAGIDLVEEMKEHNTSKPLWDLKSAVWATPNISLIDLTIGLVMDNKEGKKAGIY